MFLGEVRNIGGQLDNFALWGHAILRIGKLSFLLKEIVLIVIKLCRRWRVLKIKLRRVQKNTSLTKIEILSLIGFEEDVYPSQPINIASESKGNQSS